MRGDRGTSKRWRRLLVMFCTLLLAGSVLLVLGVTVWAQETETETETETTTEEAETETTGEEEEIAEEEIAAEEELEEPAGDVVIEYWEPEIGTRTVYYTNDYMNDIHGQKWGTSTFGSYDDYVLWPTSISPINFSSSYYKSVAAISDMNPVYFDLEGPWYFNMTTPWKVVNEVIGIHEAPDAARFPEATYAVRDLVICSGGHRMSVVEYWSNNAELQEWYTWGYTKERVLEGSEVTTKDIVVYHSPHDKGLAVPMTRTFPKMLGDTGAVSAVYEETGTVDQTSDSGTFEVVAEGRIAVPGGTYDALLIQMDLTNPSDGSTFISYQWFVQGIGIVVQTRSLPDILGPTYGEATGYSKAAGNYFYTADGILVLESFAPPGSEKQ